jgi:cytochrome c oxidase subunit III
MADRWNLIRVSLARRFFLAALAQAGVVMLIGSCLAAIFGRQAPGPELRLPWSFVFSTLCLMIGSWHLERSIGCVRRERQSDFRAALLKALVSAVAFVSIQGYGLWAIDKGVRSSAGAQLGVHGFVIMFTGLHAMHFIIAQSVLLWVTLSAFADRYDHEYFWGVRFAAWCWHILGIVWLGILFLFTIAQGNSAIAFPDSGGSASAPVLLQHPSPVQRDSSFRNAQLTCQLSVCEFA